MNIVSSIPIGVWFVVSHKDNHFACCRLTETEHIEYNIKTEIYEERSSQDILDIGLTSKDWSVTDWFEHPPLDALIINTDTCSTNSRCTCLKCTEYDNLYKS